MTEEKRTAKAVSTLLRAAAGRSPGDIFTGATSCRILSGPAMFNAYFPPRWSRAPASAPIFSRAPASAGVPATFRARSSAAI